MKAFWTPSKSYEILERVHEARVKSKRREYWRSKCNSPGASLKKAGIRFRLVAIEETESLGRESSGECLEKKEKARHVGDEDSLTGYRAMISERASVGWLKGTHGLFVEEGTLYSIFLWLNDNTSSVLFPKSRVFLINEQVRNLKKLKTS